MAVETMSQGTVLTYEEYLAEPAVEGRYSIIEGVRLFMSGATWRHQRIVRNLILLLGDYERRSGAVQAVPAPFDVVIRRAPRLQTRQPDVLLIRNETLERSGGIPARGPLEVPPELVVEVISDSETEQAFAGKIADYCEIGVQECWRVWPATRIVEVLRLTPDGPALAATCQESEAVQSLVFADLQVPASEILRP